jgi:hypothetical protein
LAFFADVLVGVVDDYVEIFHKKEPLEYKKEFLFGSCFRISCKTLTIPRGCVNLITIFSQMVFMGAKMYAANQ